jgi:hypothetical protein
MSYLCWWGFKVEIELVVNVVTELIIKDLYEVKVNDGWRYYDQQFRNLR